MRCASSPTSGARYIREDVCVACNRCAEACIFPTSPEENATNGLVFGQESRISYDPVKDNFTKCDLCYWRDGTQRACLAAARRARSSARSTSAFARAS